MRVCPKEPGGAVGRASRLQLAQSQKVLLGSAVHAAHCPELPSAPPSRHHRCSVSTIIGVWSELLRTFKAFRGQPPRPVCHWQDLPWVLLDLSWPTST
jgi:hypothetical protein